MAKCINGHHKLLVIYIRENECPGADEVVRWCENCGAIVIDLDVDGRTNPGYLMRMRLPNEALADRTNALVS